MQSRWHPLWIVVCLVALFVCSVAEFKEEISVFPLAHHGHLALQFQFSIDWDSDATGRHVHLFPKHLSSLITNQGISELHLSLTKGRWNYDLWGIPPVPTPQGAEIWLYFDSDDVLEVERRWKSTTYALSGQFCASLEYMHRKEARNSPSILSDSTHTFQALEFDDGLLTYRDIEAFRPEAQTSTPINIFPPTHNNREYNSSSMRHSILHGETLCTENLTPWVKMLPCRVQSGLGRLLAKPSTLFNFDYTSIGVHVVPTDSSQISKRLYLTFTLVLDRKLPPVQANVQSFQPPSNIHEFDLIKFLGVDFDNNVRKCPLAVSSIAKISTSTDFTADPYEVIVPPEYVTSSDSKDPKDDNRERFGLVLDLMRETNVPFSIKLKWDESASRNSLSADRGKLCHDEGPISATRWLLGWGQQNGKLALEIKNKIDFDAIITYHQVTPWLLRLYFHTTQIRFYNIDDSVSASNDVADTLNSPASFVLSSDEFASHKIHYNVTAAYDRVSGSTLQLRMKLKAKTRILVVIDYDLTFLHWTEHPPDAHRGFDIAAGILQIQYSGSNAIDTLKAKRQRGVIISADIMDSCFLCTSKAIFRIYTEGLVLSLPTPDFSMPYNVITITGTAMALFFGSMVNTLIRRYSSLYRNNSFESDRPIMQIFNLLKSKVFRISPQ